jgi:hypothetical protein
MYSRHGTDALSRWRVSDRAGDASAWGDEATFDHGAPATYSNLYQATDGAGPVLYSFVRSVGRDPNLLMSTDDGATWTLEGRVLDGPGRPYVRYAVDHRGRIHLITTEQHPRDFANGIYYGVIEDGRLRRADGTVVDGNVLDSAAVPPERLTPVFADRGTGPAWTIDLQVDRDGLPYAVFSLHRFGSVTPSTQRNTPLHRYYYARFDGASWHVHPLADAGSALARNERFYTGLVALHPHDPARVFISTDVHPATGNPLISARDGLVHHELFEGLTTDDGNTWTWTPVTTDSTVDNIRPIVPRWDGTHTALLWLRGTYSTYDDYDLDVVARITDDIAITAGSAACRSDRVLRT